MEQKTVKYKRTLRGSVGYEDLIFAGNHTHGIGLGIPSLETTAQFGRKV